MFLSQKMLYVDLINNYTNLMETLRSPFPFITLWYKPLGIKNSLPSSNTSGSSSSNWIIQSVSCRDLTTLSSSSTCHFNSESSTNSEKTLVLTLPFIFSLNWRVYILPTSTWFKTLLFSIPRDITTPISRLCSVCLLVTFVTSSEWFSSTFICISNT